MDEVLEILQALRDAPVLTGEAIVPLLEQRGWEPYRRAPAEPFYRPWHRGPGSLSIQYDPPKLRLAFTLWLRDFDEEEAALGTGAYGDDLRQEGERAAREAADEVVRRVPAAELPPVDIGAEYGEYLEEYFWTTGWRYGSRTLVVGAAQDDADAPCVVYALIY
ncbi:hypothetical protein RM780_14165 [Streptomyces sp. DSM 44917]|uniref:Uncharacterized protein n=1 Tax=Streptomyces boetiae TaxID=3075541 RepID=A0ABU2L949_9ACTN|nr:hypothetical protein [Streptomyces sp. DSM 44917]MDT0308101.1 hypothetical protein [Streptomyces sp. DSM 44917]